MNDYSVAVPNPYERMYLNNHRIGLDQELTLDALTVVKLIDALCCKKVSLCIHGPFYDEEREKARKIV